jgi:hypothetical protein
VRALRTEIEHELIVALEAELSDERERTALLEERLRRVEGRLAARDAAERVAPAPRREVRRRAPVRSIDPVRWDEAAEWDYWLRRCEGFRLLDHTGVLGVVESVRFGRALDRPETLAVVTGRPWRRRRFEVAVSEVAEVSGERHQITLAVPAGGWLLPAAARRRWPGSLRRLLVH